MSHRRGHRHSAVIFPRYLETMRLPLLAFLLVAAAPLAAQTGTITTAQPAATPAPRPLPYPYPWTDPYYYDRYRFLPARISMDSAARAVETRYQGWFVDSKQLGHDHGDPSTSSA